MSCGGAGKGWRGGMVGRNSMRRVDAEMVVRWWKTSMGTFGV